MSEEKFPDLAWDQQIPDDFGEIWRVVSVRRFWGRDHRLIYYFATEAEAREHAAERENEGDQVSSLVGYRRIEL